MPYPEVNQESLDAPHRPCSVGPLAWGVVVSRFFGEDQRAVSLESDLIPRPREVLKK